MTKIETARVPFSRSLSRMVPGWRAARDLIGLRPPGTEAGYAGHILLQAASGRRPLQAASGRFWPLLAASGRFWPRRSALRLWPLSRRFQVGDAFIAATGCVPNEEVQRSPREHALALGHMALRMNAHAATLRAPDGSQLAMRIGLFAGPLIAGCCGGELLRYSLFGPTAEGAAAMEKACAPGRVLAGAVFAQVMQGAPMPAPAGSPPGKDASARQLLEKDASSPPRTPDSGSAPIPAEAAQSAAADGEPSPPPRDGRASIRLMPGRFAPAGSVNTMERPPPGFLGRTSSVAPLRAPVRSPPLINYRPSPGSFFFSLLSAVAAFARAALSDESAFTFFLFVQLD